MDGLRFYESVGEKFHGKSFVTGLPYLKCKFDTK